MEIEEIKEKVTGYLKTTTGKVILGISIATVIFIVVTLAFVIRVSETNKLIPDINEISQTNVPEIYIPPIPEDVNYILIDGILAGSFESGYWNSFMTYEETDLIPTRQITDEEVSEEREYYEFDRTAFSVDESPFIEEGAVPEGLIEVYPQKITEYLTKQYLGNTPIIIEQIMAFGEDLVIVASSSFDLIPEDKDKMDFGVFKGIFAMSNGNLTALMFEGMLAVDMEFEEIPGETPPPIVEITEEGEEIITEVEPIPPRQIPKIDSAKYSFELIGIYDFNHDGNIEVCIKREIADNVEIFVFTKRADRYKLVLYNKVDKASLIKEPENEELVEESGIEEEGAEETGIGESNGEELETDPENPSKQQEEIPPTE